MMENLDDLLEYCLSEQFVEKLVLYDQTNAHGYMFNIMLLVPQIYCLFEKHEEALDKIEANLQKIEVGENFGSSQQAQ